ncbi:MTH1187 family thiamine-binding protein [Synechococcus sp. HK01-R]|uniref:MTH1187 family thiamine-binding protein n=1 Tax=Synechococcus sp. HK01-R TaxID=2751171 RepID=UPI0016279F92|nr:MTH1187 family thiamine-binding protein [Synechococcus sp. HK01-R]QNG26348.1 MTH1187 family thiamine-binding protein [Synechococcus sp. HK01-R]
MWVSVDLCVVPLGVGVSLAPYVAACQQVIEATGLDFELGPNGTAIEGEWESVFACVQACHEAVHHLGAPRIYTTLKVNTRVDRQQSFRDKVDSVIASRSVRPA